jgi:hypothetical protein
MRPTGHATFAHFTQIRKQAKEQAYRIAKNFMGGACGMPYRATMKPVLQIKTHTQGITETHPGAVEELRKKLIERAP